MPAAFPTRVPCYPLVFHVDKDKCITQLSCTRRIAHDSDTQHRDAQRNFQCKLTNMQVTRRRPQAVCKIVGMSLSRYDPLYLWLIKGCLLVHTVAITAKRKLAPHVGHSPPRRRTTPRRTRENGRKTLSPGTWRRSLSTETTCRFESHGLEKSWFGLSISFRYRLERKPIYDGCGCHAGASP